MQYALLLYFNPDALATFSDEDQKAITDEYWALRDDPRIVGGAGLQPVETATTVRMENGRALVTDGPFADTKEVFGGYYLFEAENLDAAIEIAARIPTITRLGGAVEIRPLVEPRR